MVKVKLCTLMTDVNWQLICFHTQSFHMMRGLTYQTSLAVVNLCLPTYVTSDASATFMSLLMLASLPEAWMWMTPSHCTIVAFHSGRSCCCPCSRHSKSWTRNLGHPYRMESHNQSPESRNTHFLCQFEHWNLLGDFQPACSDGIIRHQTWLIPGSCIAFYYQAQPYGTQPHITSWAALLRDNCFLAAV